MTRNTIYREALEKVIPEIAIRDGSILVTGASGLIGSCLVDLLMLANKFGRNFDVYALGRSKAKMKNRFSAFNDSNLLHLVEQDIQMPIEDSVHYDYIIHGASNADPRNYALYPVETMLINLSGAKNVLYYCKNHPTTRSIMLSTFEVYGNADKDVYQESDAGVIDQNMIRSCYPESKRCMEILARSFVEEYGVDAVIGRLCSIYGPTMTKDDSKAHAQFIKNALRGEEIVLKSKGDQRRTYCYVIDAVTGLLSILGKGVTGEAYNISNEESVVTIAEVAETTAMIAGTRVVYDIPDDIEKKGFSKPQNCVLDNKKLKSLNWEGKYRISAGLKECIEILKDINFLEG